MDAERGVQRQFSMRAVAAGLVLIGAIILAHRWFLTFPNRHELGWRDARVEFRRRAARTRAASRRSGWRGRGS